MTPLQFKDKLLGKKPNLNSGQMKEITGLPMREKIYNLRKYVTGSVYDLENLAKKQIICTSPKLFNDPIDTYFYYNNSDCFKKSKEILTDEIQKSIRVSCFFNQDEILKKRNVNKLTPTEILMWTHYANSHKGICFEYSVPAREFSFLDKCKYDKEKVFLSPITYLKGLATNFEDLFSMNEDDFYSEDGYENLLKTCYFTKDQSFEYEQEIRLLRYSETVEERDYLPLSFDYLSAVIFGERCTKDMKYLVSCITKQIYRKKVKLFQINEHFQEVKYE